MYYETDKTVIQNRQTVIPFENNMSRG